MDILKNSHLAVSSRDFATAVNRIKVANPVVDLDGDEMTRYGIVVMVGF